MAMYPESHPFDSLSAYEPGMVLRALQQISHLFPNFFDLKYFFILYTCMFQRAEPCSQFIYWTRDTVCRAHPSGRWWGSGPGGTPGAAWSLKTAGTEVVRSQQAGPPAQQSGAGSQVTSWKGDVQGFEADPVTW